MKELSAERIYDIAADITPFVMEGAKKILVKELWHKGAENPNNRHPYPVINPDTMEMAFAYYDHGWHFDRDYNPGENMLWMDIEKVLPKDK